MVTADSVKAKIQSLIAKVNAATGKNDTDLTSGVNALIEGYGAGSDNEYKEKLKALVERMTYMELTAEDLDGIYRIGAGAFNRHGYLSKITLPNTITSVEAYAFEASSITDIVIPDKCTVLKTYAFNSCYSLKSIDLGNGVQTIGSQCFGYSKLPTVTFPASLKTLENNVFYQNQNYTESLTFKGTTPPTISANSLSGLKADCVIFVPAEAVNEYKIATNWSVRANYIYPIGYDPSLEMVAIHVITKEIGEIEAPKVPKGMTWFDMQNSGNTPTYDGQYGPQPIFSCASATSPVYYFGYQELYTDEERTQKLTGSMLIAGEMNVYLK